MAVAPAPIWRSLLIHRRDPSPHAPACSSVLAACALVRAWTGPRAKERKREGSHSGAGAARWVSRLAEAER
eukprot:CAMPEP_0184524962 /NCGR_PEP_ID=MMETSP0198_2-20121128/9824_1 /TAXON_ID=1112570 /ORGANISM="Thraustochytrium sp., Strain LLF1b" /LENGTH=70 /DNA_ID=CAMNT_0026916349 /DNA_START=415 /DNA_END=627 /DNA_ORIENTATION=+